MMKTPLLLVAVACCLPAVSDVARAQADAVKVYLSGVSLSFPDPAGVDDMFSMNKNAIEMTLGFVAPKGSQFVKGNEKSSIGVTDARGEREEGKLEGFFTRIPDSGAFAKCPLQLKRKLAFPLKLDGVARMKVSEGTRALPAREFNVEKGAKFKVDGMEVTVKDATGQGNASGKLELEFKDTLNVEDITLTDEKDGKLDARCVSKSSFSFGSVPSRTYTYEVKRMPSKMKAVVSVSKGVKTIDVPVKMTVDLNAPSK